MYWIKFNKKNKNYSLEINEKEITSGNLMKVSEEALERGVKTDQLLLALDNMRTAGHYNTHFGFNGYFILSK